jgi:colanic acid/amylovoran biosynthesis glycosyltransferase
MKPSLDEEKSQGEIVKKILYITYRLPALSATFIDREIRVLAAAGYDIMTVSRDTPQKGEVSDETIKYYSKTLYLDQASTYRLISALFHVLVCKPLDWFNAICLIIAEKEIKNSRDRLRMLKHLIQACYLYIILKNKGISHIHAHFLNAPTSIALFLSRFLKIPFSFTEHASNMFIDPLMFGTKLRLCKKSVTISDYNKKYLLDTYGEDLAEKIHIIHCGIDPELYTPQNCEKSKPPVILAVGRLVAMKGFYFLLEACRLLKDKGIKFTCLIVGDGEEKEALLAKSAELGIDDVVTFQGAEMQERVMQFLREASLFVLPSIITDEGRRDGIPVALMEAMAMELPVISTNIVGIPELIEDRKEGLLVQEKNTAELADALEFLLRNMGTREEMGKQGRIKILREFNISNVPEQFHSVFN